MLGVKCEEKNLKFTKIIDSSIPKTLLGDAVRLRQIFLNLISNAIKFTSQGNVIISIRVVKEDSKEITVEFTVSDTGIGIRENHLSHILILLNRHLQKFHKNTEVLALVCQL